MKQSDIEYLQIQMGFVWEEYENGKWCITDNFLELKSNLSDKKVNKVCGKENLLGYYEDIRRFCKIRDMRVDKWEWD